MPAASRVGHQRVNVAVVGTPQQPTEVSIQALVVQAEPANTGVIAVGGDNTVRATAGAGRRGIVLAAGQSIAIDCDDTADVWLDASVAGEGAHLLYTAA